MKSSVEVGPGRGVLTDKLVERAKRVVAIEVDRDLVQHLRARYEAQPHVTIIEGDVLLSATRMVVPCGVMMTRSCL